jgi:hypothetical protein
VDPAIPPQATVVWSGRDAFVVRLRWQPIKPATGPAGPRERAGWAGQEQYQVLRFRDGKIRQMAEYRTIGEATRTAKMFAARETD